MTQETPFVAPFFVLEGDEGTGKGSVAKAVAARLQAKGIPVVHTREPGGTPMGEVLRELILQKREVALDPVTHILLHQAYRKEHIEKVILPALYAGTVVLSERFFMSTLALNVMPYMESNPELYQLFMDTMPYIGSKVIEPVTVLLNIDDEEVRLKRLEGRVLDEYESRTPEELLATSNAYRMFQKHPATVTLDATKPIEELTDYIVELIEAQLKLAKEQAANFAEAEARQAVAELENNSGITGADELKGLDDTAVAEEPVEPVKEFNLEEAIETFLAANIVPALFNHDAERVAQYMPEARTYLLSVYEHVKDASMFEGNNYAQLRSNLHSILHYGHQLDLLREKNKPTPVAE